MFHITIVDFTLSKTKRFTLFFLIVEFGTINIYENKKGLTYWPTVSKYMRFSGFPNMVFYSCSLTNLSTILSPLWGNSNLLFHKVITSFRKVLTLLWPTPAFGSPGPFDFCRYRFLNGYNSRFINVNFNIFELLFFFLRQKASLLFSFNK